MPLRGVLLDVDGTLIDSNDAHARAWVEAFAEHGLRVSFDEVREKVGKGGDKLLPEVAGLEEESAEGKALSERRGAIFRTRHLPALKAFPSARALLERLRDDGLSLTVASSASEEDLHALLEQAGLADLIERKTSSDDAERSKPDPDIVHAALRRAKLPASDALLLGDTPWDVRAARAAEVDCVALRCGGWGDADLAGAIAIYDDPRDLLARYDESPFARARRESASGKARGA